MIATNAVNKMELKAEEGAIELLTRYATNGREAVNMVQIAAGLAITEQRRTITKMDMEWVINSGQKSPRPDKKVLGGAFIGLVNGLAVYGPNMGALLEIEVTASAAGQPGKGTVMITGVVDEEETGGGGRKLRRRSMARSSLDNVLTVLRHQGLNTVDYDLHVNFPGGAPIDGPSAGIAMATAIYSAISEQPIDNYVAMTGELGIHGSVKPIGGVIAKVEAAKQSGITKVLVPRDNWQGIFNEMDGMRVIAVDTLEDVFQHALVPEQETVSLEETLLNPGGILNPSPSSVQGQSFR